MQEGKRLSNRDKSLQVNSFSASTCAESITSCVLVRNLQGVNLSLGSQVSIRDKRSVSQSIQNYASISRSEKLCYFQEKKERLLHVCFDL